METINQKQQGKALSRLEGALKVTGAAQYAGEYSAPDLLYGHVVNSTIPKGKIQKIYTEEILKLPGIIEIFTHENRPSLAWFNFQYSDMDAPPGSPFRPLHDAEIKYYGQPVALVVAESFEEARFAASVLKIDYEKEAFTTNFTNQLDDARAPKRGFATLLKPLPPKPKGDFDKAFDESPVQVSADDYYHGTEHHNPMEMHATTTMFEGEGKLTIYDKTQGTVNSQLYVANVFGLSFKDVRVIAPYVGGAFGSGLQPQYQLFMSVMAALELKRSVRVTLTRAQMYTFGHRPPTLQQIKVAAEMDGKITALHHKATAETSRFEDYTEVVVNWGNILYPVENTKLDYELVPVDVYSPLDMRAPGGSTGLHPLECALDELAYELKMDPLDLRLKNYAEQDDSENRPFSSKELKECYLQGAEKFGWYNRSPQPRSMRRGNRLVGYGMATGIWESMTLPAKAEATLTKEGKFRVRSAVTDIGTGTLTVMTQIAADALGVGLDEVEFEYGDSKMPFAPIQGGSYTVSTVGSAVVAACQALRKRLLKIAQKANGSLFETASESKVSLTNGHLSLSEKPDVAVSFQELLTVSGKRMIKASKTNIPNPLTLKKYTRAAHSAAFVEVEVDEELGVINVTRALTAVAAGTIVNPKTARSQIVGGMVWGISKALREETITDHRLGRYMNPNLAEYHIPVHADIHDLDVIFVEEKDDIVNPLGSKGLGEIGIVALPPAIANAVFHATGKRIHQLPIHFDMLL
ncbi:xanthine dehydrogenase family protein molybdopterin-binding subunit [Arundinibacter roseus]|uniref:Xanthine dehydrogenase family protein molybdopterin-binding subunit n=1 Tax=Arundinibacter roseus TaxID=2070510 RepID=A0A4R4KML6_9BACT|nr:xanthine dehydrogenase family protein molybdopterin-binding subunit [Arundinibacter roseus]TDB68242.1 xanthine dehydrogenase family protein molybdopterin-binding subunit [Arundinibacter roseus]